METDKNGFSYFFTELSQSLSEPGCFQNEAPVSDRADQT